MKQSVPRHPAVVHAAVLCGSTALVTVLALFIAGATGLLAGSLLVIAAAYWRYVARVAGPVMHNNSAYNALSAGRAAEAEAHLAEAERSPARLLRITTKVLRGSLCLHAADLDAAARHLGDALAAPSPWIARWYARLARGSALATRAFVHALRGDAAAARADLVAFERSAAKRPESMATAALAEAVLLRRSGDAAALRRFVDEHRQLLLECTSPRERALVRALSWSAHQRDFAYRTASRPQAGGAAGSIEAWLESVLPGAGELAEEPDVARAEPRPDPLEAGPARRRRADRSPGSEVSLPARPSLVTRHSAASIFVVWLALTAAFLAIWQLLPTDAGAESEPAALLDLAWVPCIVVGVFVGVFWFMLRRGKRAENGLLRAAVLIHGDVRAAHELLLQYARSSLHVVAARAHLMLAGLAERSADFVVALAHADAALQKLRALGAKAAAYDLVLPDVHAMRALALAGLDRPGDASAELAGLEREFPAFYLLERTRVRVLLMLAVRAGDYARAAEIAGERSPDLPISYRDDVLGEIAQLVAPAAPVARIRLNRLRHEIESDGVLGHWLDATAPALMDRFDALRAA